MFWKSVPGMTIPIKTENPKTKRFLDLFILTNWSEDIPTAAGSAVITAKIPPITGSFQGFTGQKPSNCWPQHPVRSSMIGNEPILFKAVHGSLNLVSKVDRLQFLVKFRK